MAAEVRMEPVNPRFSPYSLEYHLNTVRGNRLAVQGKKEVLNNRIKRFRSEVKYITQESFLCRSTECNYSFFTAFTHHLEVATINIDVI